MIRSWKSFLLAVSILFGFGTRARAELTESEQAQLDALKDEATGLVAGLNPQIGSPAVPLPALLQKSGDIIGEGWKSAFRQAMQDLLIHNPDASLTTIDGLQQLGAKIETLCDYVAASTKPIGVVGPGIED